MNQIPFRKSSPQRTCLDTYTSYRRFKSPLANDFNRRCGYTDCADKWFGGKNTFHIDHFKPLKKYPALKTTYSNLVYACSYINILKSDDDSAHYLDPCDVDYNLHFYRDKSGKICANPLSMQAKYMHTKLKLGLARYQVIWLLDEVYSTMEIVNESLQRLIEDSPMKVELQQLQTKLVNEFIKYFNYLTNN